MLYMYIHMCNYNSLLSVIMWHERNLNKFHLLHSNHQKCVCKYIYKYTFLEHEMRIVQFDE